MMVSACSHVLKTSAVEQHCDMCDCMYVYVSCGAVCGAMRNNNPAQ